MKNTLKITAISPVKQDKNKKNYKTIEFSTPSEVLVDTANGKVAAKALPRKTSINLYEESYLNGDMQFGYDAKLGDIFLGDIVTRKVTPYVIEFINTEEETDYRNVDTFSTIVLGDTEAGNWESLVKSAFKSRGHDLAVAEITNFSIAQETEDVKAKAGEKAF